MEFVLFKKLSSLAGIDLYMFIGAGIILALLIYAVVRYRKKAKKQAAEETPAAKFSRTQTLVYGALSITLAFVLSYFKLFTLPYDGSVTILSMLPIFAYAAYFGPKYGFTAAFAYSLLQVIQGAYIVHPVQFILDYFVGFTCLGLASFFPKNLALGSAVGGFARMLASTISGVVFFGAYAGDYGFTNVWAYSLVYNFVSIGVDTILCIIVAALPPVQRLFKRVFNKA